MAQTQNLHTLEMFLLYQDVAYEQQQGHQELLHPPKEYLAALMPRKIQSSFSKSALVPIRCLPPHDRASRTA